MKTRNVVASGRFLDQICKPKAEILDRILDRFRKRVEDVNFQPCNTWKAINALFTACTYLHFEFFAWLCRSGWGPRVSAVGDNFRAVNSLLTSSVYGSYRSGWEDIDNWWNSLLVELEAFREEMRFRAQRVIRPCRVILPKALASAISICSCVNLVD